MKVMNYVPDEWKFSEISVPVAASERNHSNGSFGVQTDAPHCRNTFLQSLF